MYKTEAQILLWKLIWGSLSEHLTINICYFILCWKHNLVLGFKEQRSPQLTSRKRGLIDRRPMGRNGHEWAEMGTLLGHHEQQRWSQGPDTPSVSSTSNGIFFKVSKVGVSASLCTSIPSLSTCFLCVLRAAVHYGHMSQLNLQQYCQLKLSSNSWNRE